MLYVPELGGPNLFSFGQTMEMGYKGGCNANSINIIDPDSDEIVLTATKQPDHCYILAIRPIQETTGKIMISQENTLRLWHERMGHINVRKIMEMSKAGLIPNIPKADTENFNCKGCLLGKSHKLPFKSISNRNFKVGEAIHADVMGPMECPSLYFNNHDLVLKDESSGFRSVYCLVSKAEVPNAVKYYLAWSSTTTGNKVKTFRTDNGTEFMDDRVKQFLLNNGIEHELSCPYAPEQNGYIERENRTLVELGRSMLAAKGLPKILWEFAVKTACYLLNITPTPKNNGFTPYEVWYGRKPVYHHLRIFGSEVYTHIPKTQRKKWDPKSKRQLFIGYTKTVQNVLVYDPKSSKVSTMRDLHFLETISEREEYNAARNEENNDNIASDTNPNDINDDQHDISDEIVKSAETINAQSNTENSLLIPSEFIVNNPIHDVNPATHTTNAINDNPIDSS